MEKLSPTVRSLARDLGVSRATVSKVLRGEGRISPATRARVLSVAKAANYQPNPLAARLMSEMRRSRGNLFRGLLAAVNIADRHKDRFDSFIREILHGSRERAQELGFKIEEFIVGSRDLSISRLDGILQSRGIQGVLLLPSWESPDFSSLDWTRYSGIYTDRNPCKPALHVVCSDHYNSLFSLLLSLKERGYLRLGLVTESWRDDRLQRRRQGALHAFQKTFPGLKAIPALVLDDLDRSIFTQWFGRWRPDFVIGHFSEMMSWMESCGALIPATHGFALLNMVYQTRACAGLDQQPREIGMRAVEQVVAQLQRNERGAPAWPTTTSILARWVEGPTLRPIALKEVAVEPRRKKALPR